MSPFNAFAFLTYNFSIELLQLRILFLGPPKAVVGHLAEARARLPSECWIVV